MAEFDGRSAATPTFWCGATPGEHDLAAGEHTLTLTAVQATSGGQFRIGLDLMRLRLQPSEGRLV